MPKAESSGDGVQKSAKASSFEAIGWDIVDDRRKVRRLEKELSDLRDRIAEKEATRWRLILTE